MIHVKRIYECFDVQICGGTTVALLKDQRKLSRLLCDDLRHELADLVQRDRPSRLVLDMQAVDYCTSELVEGLLKARRTARSYGGRVRICGVRGRAAEVFRVLRLADGPLAIDGSLNEALAALQPTASLRAERTA